ncbi:MAG TPA: outer membrane beta-barrel protein [Pyrinomonadaceae bacterium]|jgi:hypothetical protein
MRPFASLLLVALFFCLSSPCARAQRTTLETENAELRRRVAALEERLEKLEAKERDKQSEKKSTGAASAGAPGSPSNEDASSQKAPQVGEKPAAHPPAAEEQKKSDAGGLYSFLKTTDVSGFIDTYYSFNFNRPSARESAARSFDQRHNQFALSVAEISFEREPREDSRFGFRLDLNFGPAADILSEAEPGDIEVYKHMQEAYGSYLAPVGRGLRLDVGKFGSWAGAEEDEAKDNWNYSRSLLYTFAQPAYHMGLRATYKFNKQFSLTGALVNGWNNVEENNDGKTFGLLVSLTPGEKLSVEQTYIFGPEQPDDTRHKRHFFDTSIFYDLDPRLSFMGNYDYGFDTLADGSRVRWQGVAAGLRYVPSKRLAFSPRLEWYRDYDGFTTGTAQRLREFTFTGEYKLAENLITRLEYRRDSSDQFFFQKSDPNLFARTQTTLTGGLIWSFTTKEQKSDDDDDSKPSSAAQPASAKTSSSLPNSSPAASETNRPRRMKPTAHAEEHAQLSRETTDAVSASSSTSQTASASTRKAPTATAFKITDRLPAPVAKGVQTTKTTEAASNADLNKRRP